MRANGVAGNGGNGTRGRRIGRTRGRALRVCGAALAIALLGPSLQACGVRVPADPDGTLDTVSGGTLRIGLSPEPGLVDVTARDPSGPLVDAAARVAEELDAEPEWTVRGEEGLVGMIERDELDLAVGGFTEDTPWTDRVGVSRAFDRLPGAEGRRVVVLVLMGENAFLSEVEEILDAESQPKADAESQPRAQQNPEQNPERAS
ncbi:hypothetical protein [Leucobacter ruminantium]|uniref:Solute-binding protein family 3/N-terminal domain-containing protein n=1 Tax=Leucobacter ruminantium TaxID=1289170 RepID=A0A939RXC6_9MICO|nr:hypothetical protein [Leucobacter ruminantium]MBO1804548.1 hypothetical protein [Leucobacter ruminantium]